MNNWIGVELMIYFKHEIKWGPIVVGLTDLGQVAGLWFEGQKYFPDIEPNALWIKIDPDLREDSIEPDMEKGAIREEVIETAKDLVGQLKEYEDGLRSEFDLPLKPKGTEFRQLVWKELLKIPCGQTVTYGHISKALAAKMGKETMSAQAVGGAVGHNPISILIPCHRVLGSGGDLTGYAGGIQKKAALLDHEKEFVN